MAFATDWTAEIIPSQDPKETVPAIKWLDDTVPVEIIPQGTDFESRVELRMQFDKPGWNLIKDSNTLEPLNTDSHQYALNIRLTSEVTPFEIIAIGPYGEVEMQKVLIRVLDWQNFRQKSVEGPPKRTYLFASLGISSIAFKETELADFSMIATTLKFTYNYLLTPPQWEFGTNGYLNLLPLKKNGTENTVRFLGLNLRFGYVLPFVKAPARLSFLIGAYFSSMLGTNNQFGYKTLLYPQYYPTFRIKTRQGDAYYVYLKYVPLTSSFGLSLKEREWATGFGWEHPLHDGTPLSLSFDFSDFQFLVKSSHEISTTSFTVNLGYGW